MPTLFEFFLLCITSFFTMVNPIGVIPPYMAMSHGMSDRDSRVLALKACITAFIVLVLFALAGNLIFRFFSISVDSLRVVGGILFFILGFDMLQARISKRQKAVDENEIEYNTDLAITPLAIPFICGPGAITMAILLMKQASEMSHKVVFFSSVAFVMVITCLTLIGGKRVINFLGPSGSKVLTRVMGLIVMVIAVEFFFAGLGPLIQRLELS
jgi:multiple antibiotic resistance protein